MTPPQPFMTSRIRGFVCRSCLSQLRKPQRPRTPWLVRNITSDGPWRTGAPKGKKTAEPIVRYFDQTPDGVRQEMEDDPEALAMLKQVEDRIRMLEGRQDDEDLGEGPDDYLGEEFDDDLGEEHYDPAVLMEQAMKGYGLPDNITAAMEEMEAQMENADNLENMSEEERRELRNRILNIGTDAVPPSSPRTPPQSVANAPAPEASTVVPPGLTPPNLSESVVINPAMYPEEYRRRILALNTALREASKRIQEGQRLVAEVHKKAWRSYLMCRKVLVSQPTDVPLGVWTTLWHIFADDQPINLDRMAHINYLGRDMLQVGIPLQGSQQLLYIEACFLEEDRGVAIGMWNKAKQSLSDDKNALRDYWKLGIQMFCRNGQVEHALQAARALFNTTDEASDFRMLIPIIQAYLARDTDAGKQRAWALYIRLRLILGPDMNMGDYDAITSIFLTANQPDLALGAFKDMMLTGKKSAAEQDSTALYRKATGIKGGLDLATIDNGELNWQDSRTLATLPNEFNNKYFFGKWIKKLIGEEELDAAKKVFDLMVDRGICPDAKHMNGLIGALYRTGTVRNQTLAEDMAWKMIAARIQFVQQRDLRNQIQLKEPLRAVKVAGKDGQKSPFLTPNATIETFSILIQQYRRRQKQDRLVDLFSTLKKARIAPNTFFMNQLIMVDTKSHQTQWAWDTYLSLVQTHGVHPDFDTFEFLWHLMKKTTDPVSRGSQRPFATCRTLFAEMVKRASDLNKREQMPRELYDEIILCFSLAEDQVGTAIALRALQRIFNMYPSESTVRTVVLQLSRVRLRNAAGSRPRRLDLNRATKDRIAQVTQVLATFKDQRVEQLSRQGIDFEKLQEEEKLEESLILLSNLLQYVYQAKVKGLEAQLGSITEVSKIAAEQMGVPECSGWMEHSGSQESQ